MQFLTIEQVMEKIRDKVSKYVDCPQSLSLSTVAKEVMSVNPHVITAGMHEIMKGCHNTINIVMEHPAVEDFPLTRYTRFMKDAMNDIIQHYYLNDMSSLTILNLAISGLHTSATYIEEMAALIEQSNNLTQKKLCDKFTEKAESHTLDPDTISKIQYKIVELEVQLRLAEDENGFLNKDLDELEQQEKTAKGVERVVLSKRIDAKKVVIEQSETKIELLERTKRYYQEQLDSGTIDTIVK